MFAPVNYNGTTALVRTCQHQAAPMPTIAFAPALQRHVPCPPQQVAACELRTALEAAFAQAPRLRDYVLDDQGGVRRHVAVFIDGRLLADRRDLTVALDAHSEVYVAQALSGG